MEYSWLTELLKETDEAETPRAWILWSGLSAIGAVSSFNVFLDRYYYKLSPNMYVMLIGKSGLGKGLGTWLAKTLVESCDITRVIAGRNSIEAIINDLSKSKSREDKKPMLKDARGYLISGEFANFIISSPNALTILTEWYDTHYQGEWKNTLKHSGVEKLKGVNINMLGAASPAHFKDFVSERDVEGGFIGRTLLIYADKRHRINPLTIAPAEAINIDKLADGLNRISQVTGEFKWTDGGRKVFEPWFQQFRTTERDDRTGTDQRFPDHVLKVAMNLSLSRRDDLLLHGREIEEAIALCNGLMNNVRRAMAGSGKHALAKGMGLVINDLLKSDKPISRKQILSKHWGDIDSFDMDKIQTTLEEAKALIVETEGGETLYSLTPEFRQQYMELKKEKSNDGKA